MHRKRLHILFGQTKKKRFGNIPKSNYNFDKKTHLRLTLCLTIQNIQHTCTVAVPIKSWLMGKEDGSALDSFNVVGYGDFDTRCHVLEMPVPHIRHIYCVDVCRGCGGTAL